MTQRFLILHNHLYLDFNTLPSFFLHRFSSVHSNSSSRWIAVPHVTLPYLVNVKFSWRSLLIMHPWNFSRLFLIVSIIFITIHIFFKPFSLLTFSVHHCLIFSLEHNYLGRHKSHFRLWSMFKHSGPYVRINIA